MPANATLPSPDFHRTPLEKLKADALACLNSAQRPASFVDRAVADAMWTVLRAEAKARGFYIAVVRRGHTLDVELRPLEVAWADKLARSATLS